MDIWDYFDRVQRSCDNRSLNSADLECAALIGTTDRGRILGDLVFDQLEDVCNARLKVSEVIEIVDEREVVIHEYAYYLIVDGVEFWGWERDLSHDPPVHRHARDHAERLDAEPIELPAAIQMAWGDVSDYVAQISPEENSEDV